MENKIQKDVIDNNLLDAAGLTGKVLKLEKRIEIIDTEESFPDFNSEEVKTVPDKETKKNLFKHFLYDVGVDKLINLVLGDLFKKKVIDKSNIVESPTFDGEITIVDNIKKNFNNNKNIVLTKDQDYILFALIHTVSPYIYLKENLSTCPSNFVIIKNNAFTKNISILTAFFNKTDYFPGIKNTTLTEDRCKQFVSYAGCVLKEEIEIKALLACFVFWFRNFKKRIFYFSEFKNFNKVSEYLNNFIEYISMDTGFYEKGSSVNVISCVDLHCYFNETKQLRPIDLNGEVVFVNY